MQKDKIETLIGFAVKSNKIIYGKDNIESAKKSPFLIVLCQTTSANTKKEVEFIAKKRMIPILTTTKNLSDIVFKPNCKVIALKDKNMVQAIIENVNNSYLLMNHESQE